MLVFVMMMIIIIVQPIFIIVLVIFVVMMTIIIILLAITKKNADYWYPKVLGAYSCLKLTSQLLVWGLVLGLENPGP